MPPPITATASTAITSPFLLRCGCIGVGASTVLSLPAPVGGIPERDSGCGAMMGAKPGADVRSIVYSRNVGRQNGNSACSSSAALRGRASGLSDIAATITASSSTGTSGRRSRGRAYSPIITLYMSWL